MNENPFASLEFLPANFIMCTSGYNKINTSPESKATSDD